MSEHTKNTPTGIRTRRRVGLAVAALSALGLTTVACGDDESSSTAMDTAAPSTAAPATDAPTTAAPSDEVVIEGAWARASPAMAEMGAAYMMITSPVDDKLVGATADPSICETVEVHEVVMEMGMDMGSDTTMGMGSDNTMPSGQMTMREVAFVELPAGTTVELKPGGYHIMLFGLTAPLELGSTIQLTLVFEQAGEITVDVPVLEEAPSA